MSLEDNKAIVRRYQEILNNNDLDALGEVMAEDISMPDILPGMPPGLEGAKTINRMAIAGMPDFHVAIEELIAEGDRVAARVTITGAHSGEFFGIPPTGRRISAIGMYAVRIAGGKIVEHRGVEDALGILQQLGAIPSMS